LDKTIADEAFSPFDKDSMPKLEEFVKKTDVLLIVRLGKKKTDKRLAVIPMITIFPEQADSALAMADSLGADSTLAEEPEEEIAEEGASEVADSTNATEGEGDAEQPAAEEAEKPKEKEEEGFGDEPEIPKPKEDAPKPKKKTDPKDPEISDPNLKAEFEESFGDEPKLEDLNDLPPLEEEFAPPQNNTPAKKKKGAKKGPKKEAPKPKVEDEPAPDDDKF
jgi:hypothetical protein